MILNPGERKASPADPMKPAGGISVGGAINYLPSISWYALINSDRPTVTYPG
jgi:hypothetical protein